MRQGFQTPTHTPPKRVTKISFFLSNTGSDNLENDKAITPAFNVGPSLARQRNFFLKKSVVRGWNPSEKHSESAHAKDYFCHSKHFKP